MNMPPGYPFAAIVGLESVKRALLLAAVDPAIGGVLVEGPRGTAKSTIARALADLLPEGRLVTLPLGTTEERLLGSLDLEKVLASGEVHFSPGLLQAAHRGVLYVDEVNLLPDHLVDLLLDVGMFTPPETLEAAEVAAWTSVARVLLNLHETITRS